ncbi:MAG: hypothetical protein E7007_03200 [Alphaproteobacteria bacterium]|nr:hypothetical protein [Alphaproteobacteria bacterium]
MLLPLALLSALYFKTSDGNIYHTIDVIPDGMCVLNNNGTELVYEATNFNTCNEIVLQPGCYRAELRGGIGLQNEYCLDIAEQDFTPTISAIFNINEPTTVYVFRGGDGNAAGVNVVNNGTGSFGGGASGVDSILVVGDRVWRASGGAGKTCATSIKKRQINVAGAYTSIAVGNGVGGNSELVQLVSQKRVYVSREPYRYGIGGGGGASPNGAGGTDWQYHYDFINTDEYVNAGTNGTDERGGNGGDIYVCNNLSCTSMVSATGGIGGATVTYECGGQTAKSYGGGGGGGAYNGNNSTAVNGGDGGSGSTGHSDVSFVRIYKI